MGSKAQKQAMKKIAGTLKLDLAQFQELERFSEFTEELDDQTKATIEKGKRLLEVLKQDDLGPLSFEKEVVIIFAGTKGYLGNFDIGKIKKFKSDLIAEVETQKPELLKKIKETGDLDEQGQAELGKIIKDLISSS